MYQPIVQLKSGGYLVINPTEALVSIDINSGRSTREHNIEQTAFSTNIEAAAEIARQLRLRDMAGLVVIDFIDMEQSSHVRKVEKAMKEALKNDRARIQIGRISSFGLMEMSRQRLRTGVLEASTKPCPHCEGTGLMRTAASAGLSALRIIEDEAARGRGEKILLRAGREAAVYVLNKKRAELADIEQRYGVSIDVMIDEGFEGARMAVESSGPRPTGVPRIESARVDEPEDEEEIHDEEHDEDIVEISLEDDEDEEGEGEPRQHEAAEGERPGRRRRRRRRGGRGRSRREGEPGEAGEAAPAEAEAAPEEQPEGAQEEPSAEPGRSRRRRGRKGKPSEAAEPVIDPESSPMVERPVDEEPAITQTEAAEQPKPKRRRGKKAAAEAEAEVTVPEPAPADAPPAETADEAPEAAKPARKRRSKAKAEPETAAEPPAKPPAIVAANTDAATESEGEPRRGWWQRTFG
jgi:ribonuclease E